MLQFDEESSIPSRYFFNSRQWIEAIFPFLNFCLTGKMQPEPNGSEQKMVADDRRCSACGKNKTIEQPLSSSLTSEGYGFEDFLQPAYYFIFRYCARRTLIRVSYSFTGKEANQNDELKETRLWHFYVSDIRDEETPTRNSPVASDRNFCLLFGSCQSHSTYLGLIKLLTRWITIQTEFTAWANFSANKIWREGYFRMHLR